MYLYTIYHDNQDVKIAYRVRDKRSSRTFTAPVSSTGQALKRLIQPTAGYSHIPNRSKQMVTYYGRYSNIPRGNRQKNGHDNVIPCILEPEVDIKIRRRNRARLIQQIYEVDPLIFPECQGLMCIISSIEDTAVIRTILEHPDIWLIRSRPPPNTPGMTICDHNASKIKSEAHRIGLSENRRKWPAQGGSTTKNEAEADLPHPKASQSLTLSLA